VSRLSLLGKVILSSRKVAVWREHAGNESKSLNEKNLERELASLESIALFAEKHLGKDIAANWLKQMKDYYRLVFIYHNTTVSPGMSTILFIVKHWRFNWLYPKYIIKNILLKMGYSFKPKSQ
jgi:hypothetical protein